jgi:Family of unknown function (DUF5678)
MSKNGKALEQIDLARHMENRRQISQEKLLPYAGQHVAFSADGTHVVAAGADYEALAARLRDLGIDGGEVVWSYVPGPDEDTWL